MKKLLVVVLIVVIVMHSQFVVFADFLAGSSESLLEFDDAVIFSEGACSGGNGICNALRRGDANVWYNGNFLFRGRLWQCTVCGTIYVTEFEPYYSPYIGRMCSRAWSGNVGTNVIIEVDSYANVNSNSVEGINFVYTNY